MNTTLEGEYPSQAKKNHRVVVTQHGGPEVLQMIEEALPEPGPGEVRVRVQAAGVSAYDLMQRSSGSLPGVPKVPYTPGEDIAGVVEKLGDGVDVVFDPVGGARQLRRSHKALRRGGRLVWFGVAATKKGGLRVIPFTLLTVALLKLVPGGKKVPMAPDLSQFAPAHNDWYRQTLADLLDALAAGRLNPVVAERIPLAEAARAHELLGRGGHAGKVVLVPGA